MPINDLQPRNGTQAEDEGLKIVRLEAQNVKRLKAVQITPEGNLVVIGGQNAQGKSSVLDAIMYALAGKSAVCDRPVRDGERSAEVSVDLGEFVVTRTFNAGGSTAIVVKGKDGSYKASPQKLLDELCGTMAFDPLEFSRMKPADQKETLKRLVGLDFTKLDQERQELYDERTMVGRELKVQKGALELAAVHFDAPDCEVSVAELSAELQKALAANSTNDQFRRRFQQMTDDLAEAEKRVEAARVELQRAEAALAAINTLREDAAEELDDLKDIDIAPIQEQIANAEQLNRAFREEQERAKLGRAVTGLEKTVETLTEKIAAIDAQKAQALRDAQFPVPGLSFDEEGITFQNVPFAQASAAEQLKVSVAMGIAMNPRLKVLLIRDGSLLDSGSLATLAQMADESGCQVWIERVGDGEEVSVLIEDGMVVERDGSVPEKPVGGKKAAAPVVLAQQGAGDLVGSFMGNLEGI